MNARLAAGICAAVILTGCSGGTTSPATTDGGKVSVKTASALTEREMQKTCEAIFGKATDVSQAVYGESSDFTWEVDDLNFNGAYGLSCRLTAVGSKKSALTLNLTSDATTVTNKAPEATIGQIALDVDTRNAPGALSDQAKNAIDELVQQAKERISD